ncbi:3-oxoadipyl-CoA thiolase [Nisaea acidiphila]|uniref:Beta-ketoadipyl-CoA thiolase n=1 Tax=Nisaea acidiphila TaxID=1862145 RepID=A0A9J7ASG7_9PROT|nr:3-oxoadipyl-CoA thiolase [Nisaea acidiphila]UUX50595.1 3-oxoadipyl-CoA thiolase [Nisaea acidiphila]
MTEAFICDAIRTPIGRYGGALSPVRADDLAAHPLKSLMARNGSVDWDDLDDVYYGCVNQAGEDNRNVARMALLLAGLSTEVPGATVNRLCASGMEAVNAAARAIRSGEGDFFIAGGVESMSRAPFVMGKATSAFDRNAEIYDTTIGWRFVNPQMEKQYGTDSMPETAENVAQQFQISREDQDAFALRSQQKAGKAMENGRLAREIAAVEIQGRKGAVTVVDTDEHPRPSTTMEALAKLGTPFRKEGGSVTAGNASGVNDGAAAMIVCTEEAAKRHGLTPRARIVTGAAAGVEPRIMGVGPIPASRKVLERAGLKVDDLSVMELNEAFAAQVIASLRDLGIADDDERVNPNGGAIALGHPLGASGARLIMTATEELQDKGGKYALCTMCIGVGQGMATIIEKV